MPAHDDRVLFEGQILEGAQAGLIWETVLRKRQGYARAFHNFEVERVAAMRDNELGYRDNLGIPEARNF